MNEFNIFPYEELETEAEKRRKRAEIALLMEAYLADGGKIRRVKIKEVTPKPKFKYQNRHQRSLAKAKGK